MPDLGIADGTGLTSAFFETYVRQQVVVQATSTTRPTGVEGRLVAETDTNDLSVHDGTGWLPIANWGAYKAYTPTISASTTAPTGWTVSGRYIQLGKTVIGIASFTFGAGTAAAGTLRFGLPLAPATAWYGFQIGGGVANDSGTAYYRSVVCGSGTFAEMYSENGTAVTGAAPFTPAAADFYRVTFRYEAA